MDADRPNRTPLAISSADRVSDARITDRTGPKISSWAMRMSASTSIEDRRCDEESVVESAVRQPIAAAHQLRPFCLADADVFEDGVELRLVDRRADVGLWIEAVADHERRGTRVQPLDELVGDRLVDHRAAGCGAALAGGPEGSLHRALDGELEIRVRENHDRVLAAHLALTLDASRCGRGVERRADIVRSGERDGLDRGMLDDRVADLAAAADEPD